MAEVEQFSAKSNNILSSVEKLIPPTLIITFCLVFVHLFIEEFWMTDYFIMQQLALSAYVDKGPYNIGQA